MGLEAAGLGEALVAQLAAYLVADAVGAKEQLDICAASNPPAEVMGFVSSIIEEVNTALAG